MEKSKEHENFGALARGMRKRRGIRARHRGVHAESPQRERLRHQLKLIDLQLQDLVDQI
jgi:hypothetical protein